MRTIEEITSDIKKIEGEFNKLVMSEISDKDIRQLATIEDRLNREPDKTGSIKDIEVDVKTVGKMKLSEFIKIAVKDAKDKTDTSKIRETRSKLTELKNELFEVVKA